MKKFLPFATGIYTTAPGLAPLSKNPDGASKIFDIDENYPIYIDNKIKCRDEDINKYHCIADFSHATRDAVNGFLLSRMTSEFPDVFHLDGSTLTNRNTGKTIELSDNPSQEYLSVFDALCSQLQEDVAVVQMQGDKDWLTAIHLCSPNHWDPRTKIGRPFNEIHAPVPEIGRTVKNYQVMLKMIIDKDPFTRFAWGISTDTQLNHHPEVPPGKDPDAWRGRRVADNDTEFFVRTERQSLIGLKSVNAFIFTIRTYFYKVSDLNNEEKLGLASAVNTMTDASLEYKGMLGLKAKLMEVLS